MIDATVECGPGCEKDEKAIIVVTPAVHNLLEALELTPFEWNGQSGYVLMPTIQSTISDIVDQRNEAASVDPMSEIQSAGEWELEDIDSLLGFLIVVRDSILAHRGIANNVTVTE